MYLAGGATVTPVGSSMQQMDFATVQGHDETRIAAAAGVPPIIVGLSEGLEAATYSNYGQARRALADALLWPLWGSFADTVGQVVTVPGNARLWIDASGIAFLREDAADIANILYVKSEAINKLFMSGFDPDSIVDAIEANDLTQLVHTGLPSVQLQPGAVAPLPSVAAPNALPAPAQGKLPAPAQTKLPNQPETPKENSVRLLEPFLQREVHIHEAPIDVHPASVTVEAAQITVEPAAVTVQPQINFAAPPRLIRETTFIKDEAGEIIGSRETEREAD